MKETASPSSASTGARKTVLLADDDRDVRLVTKAMLEAEGIRVIEANNGEDAVKKFREHKNIINLLILDVMMPEKNGRQVYDEIIQLRPGTKVLFMSGYSSGILSEKDILESRHSFIPKPFTSKKFLKRVKESF